MGYNGKWMDSFNASIITDKDRPHLKGKIILETPSIDYIFSKEQWSEFKEKVNSI